MTRLLLIRHGHSTWNAAGLWQGWADPPLSERGRAEAQAAADALAPFAGAVYSSDLERAVQTATIIATALSLPDPILDPGLREIDVGAWSGLTHDQIATLHPVSYDAWRQGRLVRRPGGESFPQFRTRIVSALEAIARSCAGDALVVTHSGVIRDIERHLGRPPGKIPNLGGRWVLAMPLRLDGEPVALAGSVDVAEAL